MVEARKEIPPKELAKKLAKYYHLDFNDGHFTFIFTLPMGDKIGIYPSFGIVIFQHITTAGKGRPFYILVELHALHGKSILNSLPCFTQPQKHLFITVRFNPSRHAGEAAN